MKQFYIIANPKYFKKAMGWDMKHEEVRRTEDNLVLFVATDNVPETNIIEPYHCGWHDTDLPYGLWTTSSEVKELYRGDNYGKD